MRIPAVAILIALVTISLPAQQNDSVARVGDVIIIRMTGDVANEYAKRTSKELAKRISEVPDGAPLSGLRVELSATVDHVLPDGALWIEYSHMMRDQKPVRLVTLTGKIDPQKITTDVTPKGTKVLGSPGAEPTVTTEDFKNRRLELTDLKGFKLRIWTLVDEIGE